MATESNIIIHLTTTLQSKYKTGWIKSSYTKMLLKFFAAFFQSLNTKIVTNTKKSQISHTNLFNS